MNFYILAVVAAFLFFSCKNTSDTSTHSSDSTSTESSGSEITLQENKTKQKDTFVIAQPEKDTIPNGHTSDREIPDIYPTLGEAIDITFDAKRNYEENVKMYKKIAQLVEEYGGYEEASKHLTPQQLEIYEHEEEYVDEDHLQVGPLGCSWYCGGGPSDIRSSSHLKPIQNFNYVAENIHDFTLRTAWVEGKSGNGIGESVLFVFEEDSPPVTTVEIYNGYMKTEKTWQENGRVKQLAVYVNGYKYANLHLKDTTAKQIFDIGSHQGKGRDLVLKFKITDIYPGDKYEDVAISELNFDGTGVH